mgnify:CR=1 FL=1
MSRWSVRIALGLLTAAVVALFAETFRLAELAGRLEREAHAAGREAEALRRELATRATSPRAEEPGGAADFDATVGLSDYARLRLQLFETERRLAATTELLEQRNEELSRRAEAAEERARRALSPMPEGVRLCLDGLHECLRAEGFYDQRFLRATALDDDGLHGVELLDATGDGLGVAFVTAARMTATVDRAAGVVELRFFEGHRTADGQRTPLPEDGLALTFRAVDGRLFERRLPYLVRGEGSYPADDAAPGPRPTDVDPGTRRQWLARLEKVLLAADLDERWRATRLRGMAEGWFLEVDFVATDARGHVVASAHCARAAIEVDPVRGVASLWLQDGVLRRQGVESSITGEGYRMLLPGLTPRQATDAMFGMVVNR